MRQNTSFRHLSALFFGLFSGFLCFLQTNRLVPLLDWSFVSEYSFRIAIGQVPYKDFDLVVTPGTFLVQAFLIKTFGASFFVQQVYSVAQAIISSYLSTQLCFRLSGKELRAWGVILLSIFGIGIFYPFPFYDNDAVFLSLVTVGWWIFLLEKQSKPLAWVLLGAFASTVPLFKQTTGLGLITGITIGNVLLARQHLKPFLCGMLVCCLLLGSLFVAFAGVEGLENAFHWIFVVAAKTKSGMLARITADLTAKGVFFQTICLVVAILMAQATNCKLILLYGVVPFYGFCYEPFRYFQTGDLWAMSATISNVWIVVTYATIGVSAYRIIFKQSLNRQLVYAFPLLLVCWTTFLSQGVWGSSYATWVLLPVFLVVLSSDIKDWKGLFISQTLALAVFLGLSFYVFTNFRLASYTSSKGAQMKSDTLALNGLITPGPWLPAMDEMFKWVTAKIPKEDKVVAIPGEDPFFFVTGRAPQLRLFQMNSGTFPYSSERQIVDALNEKIEWIVFKQNLQNPLGFIDLSGAHQKISQNYDLVKELTGYKIYRLKKTP